MFYFVEGDWDSEHKHQIYARYLDLTYFLEEVERDEKMWPGQAEASGPGKG